ncbi:hypothetical protein [Streptomyces antibioticus]|uniref:hypothetical protein n=1 Tax=Streptomyces antibioticus TaxID=1890 RepID=UPI00224F1A9C|nr:hypothetical protein [Streptomyces antibioticus]MCX4743836.1 hypothetical protein [Streptomyces antibioticus]
MSTPHDRRPGADDPTSPAPLADTRVEDDDEYSATMLASHWIQRPDDATTMLAGAGAPPTGSADTPEPTVPTGPTGPTGPQGRVDGTMLRFGPGVTASLSQGVHTTLAPVAPPPVRRHRRLRRHALPALVLVAAVIFLFWRGHSPPELTVRSVSATAAEPGTGCDGTADVVGVVRTDGRPGEFSYRWVRNDGTTSDVLRASVDRGREEVRLHLYWTFQGPGRYAAEAELRILSPSRKTATARFTYDCS